MPVRVFLYNSNLVCTVKSSVPLTSKLQERPMPSQAYPGVVYGDGKSATPRFPKWFKS
jgi:hypothetical protein